jgi:hypothetical protein
MARPRPGGRPGDRPGLGDRLIGRLADRLAVGANHRAPTLALEPTPDLEPATRQRIEAGIEAYLAGIAARLASRGLAGPRRARQAIIAELRDGLHAATTANLEQGLPPDQAARAALAEFGDPATVAAAFTPELAGLQARRTALALARTGPLVGVLWIAALVATHAPPIDQRLAGGWLALPLVGLGIATAALGTIVTVATTGRPSRWLTPHPRRAPAAAATVAIAAMAVDVTLLGMLAGQAINAPATITAPPGVGPGAGGARAAVAVALAAGASLTRLALSGRAARRTLAARASLA